MTTPNLTPIPLVEFPVAENHCRLPASFLHSFLPSFLPSLPPPHYTTMTAFILAPSIARERELEKEYLQLVEYRYTDGLFMEDCNRKKVMLWRIGCLEGELEEVRRVNGVVDGEGEGGNEWWEGRRCVEWRR